MTCSRSTSNNKTCSFHRFIFNQMTRLINASCVIEIDCTLVMITRSSDLNLMNKWTCLCSSLYNESWCFRMLRWAANVHIIWSERCNAFMYCWVTFMSWFIEFSIKLRKKLIKLNHVCWAANIVSSWLRIFASAKRLRDDFVLLSSTLLRQCINHSSSSWELKWKLDDFSSSFQWLAESQSLIK